MLEIFKRNVFVNSILLLPYAIFLRFNEFFAPQIVAPRPEFSSMLNTLYVATDTGITQTVIATILVFIQALMINKIAIKQKLFKDTNLVAGLIYILISASLPDFNALSPTLIAMTFMIPAIGIIMQTYNSSDASTQVFGSGVLVGIAALFYYPFYYFFFITLISILILKSFKFKERIQHLLALFIPTFMLFTVEYFNNASQYVVPSYFLANFQYDFTLLVQDIKGLFTVVIISIAMIVAVLNYGNYRLQKPTATQKKLDILYWVALFSVVSIIFTYKTEYSHIYILLFPLSIFLALSILRLKSKIVAEIVHLVLVIFVIIIQFKLIQLT